MSGTPPRFSRTPLSVAPGASTTTLADECDQLRQLAEQNAGFYRNGGDPAHQAAAQNYQNAYIACVNTSSGGASGTGVRATAGIPGPSFDSSSNSGGAAQQPNSQKNTSPNTASCQQYDSVNKVCCPGGIQLHCFSDDWRKALDLARQQDGRVELRYFVYNPPNYSEDVISEAQYERIGRGEATYDDIRGEQIDALAARILADIERRYQEFLKNTPDSPEALAVIQSIMNGTADQ